MPKVTLNSTLSWFMYNRASKDNGQLHISDRRKCYAGLILWILTRNVYSRRWELSLAVESLTRIPQTIQAVICLV